MKLRKQTSDAREKRTSQQSELQTYIGADHFTMHGLHVNAWFRM